MIFRRIHGRIIPIASNAIAGSIYGATAGHVGGLAASNKDLKKLQEGIKSNTKDSRSIVKSSGVKDVKVISSNRDLKGFGFFMRRALTGPLKDARSGSNAYAFRDKNKDYIIVGKKSNPEVIGHELGHIIDFRKNGKLGFFETGVIGALTGGTLKREKEGWKNSPISKKTLKVHALKTYSKSELGTRIGAVAGFVSGGLYAAIKGYK